jgi:hypothetical protein
VHIEPTAQRAAALAEFERQGDMPVQRLQVSARQIDIGTAGPAFPVATRSQQRLGETGDGAETFAPFERRRGVEAEVVVQQTIVLGAVSSSLPPRASPATKIRPILSRRTSSCAPSISS